MVIQQIAYETITINLPADRDQTFSAPIKLNPKIYDGNEISVQGEDASEWRKLYKQFFKAFIGQTENASNCGILNPEVIELARDSEDDMLIAESDSIIRIRNDALGYYIDLILQYFKWDAKKDIGRFKILPLFKELNQPAVRKTIQQRLETYRDSPQHFLTGLIQDNLEKQNFHITRKIITSLADTIKHDKKLLLKLCVYIAPDTKLRGLYELNFGDFLRVTFSRHPFFKKEISYIKILKDPVLLYKSGLLYDPMSMETAGVWGKRRFADTLPLDYQADFLRN